MINSPSQAIALLGGWKAIASRINRPLTTVASWATRNSIPVEAWPDIVDMAVELGKSEITVETLAKAQAAVAAQRPKRRRAA